MAMGVIFDIDGTLVDSVDLHAAAWQRAMRDFGKDVAFEAVRAQIGKGGDQLLPVFFSQDELKRIGPRLETHRAELFRREYLPRVRPFPGVRALFEELRSRGQRIALASSSDEEEVVHYQRIAEVADLTDAVVSKALVEHSKPCPDVFAAALAKLKIAAGSVMVVGDTPYDAEAAGKAGLPTIGVLCGGFPEDKLRKAGCIAIYRDPADLLARIEGSPLVS